MMMDILVLILFSLTIFFAMRKGFVMTVVSFLRGIATVVIAWLFCDDLAALLLEKTELGLALTDKIQTGLHEKWTASRVYEILPELFKESADASASSVITDNTDKLANLLLLDFDRAASASVAAYARFLARIPRRLCRRA